jgi:hypothetical protein
MMDLFWNWLILGMYIEEEDEESEEEEYEDD